MVRNSFAILKSTNPKIALTLLQIWQSYNYPIFKRLILYASVQNCQLDNDYDNQIYEITLSTFLKNNCELMFNCIYFDEIIKFINNFKCSKPGLSEKILDELVNIDFDKIKLHIVKTKEIFDILKSNISDFNSHYKNLFETVNEKFEIYNLKLEIILSC